ncbi:MAG: hypothetical protein U0872_03350 [Planctomycetaceae bacterium]
MAVGRRRLRSGTKTLALFVGLDRELQADVGAVIKSHCLDCHSTQETAGEVDLEQFRTIDDVRKHPRVWLKVVEMLDNGEMLPRTLPRCPPTSESSCVVGSIAT